MARAPRDPALKPYRLFVYALYGVCCAFLFTQLVRSVAADLYGSRREPAHRQTPMACLDDIGRLYDQLSARAVQPAPRGLDSDQLAREWDTWSRRWESEVQRVSERCDLASGGPGTRHLSEALDGVEELRRRLARSGEDASAEARKVKQELDDAREELKGTKL